MRWRAYLPAFSVHLACLLQLYLGASWSLLTVTYVFGLVPIIDSLLPRDRRNPSTEEVERLEHDPSFRWVLWSAIVADTVVLAVSLTQARAWGWAELLGNALAVGIVTGGVGITVAHELLHKTTLPERFFAHLALLEVCYMHFVIEHVLGHHARVATLEDPATARRGETVYAFVSRSVRDSWRSAWDFETRRLGRRGIPPWIPRNAMLWYAVLPVLLVLLVARLGGPCAMAFFLLQSAVAVILLEMVNYVEHYGLLRNRVGHRYEPFDHRHAWDSDHLLSNRLLFRLVRHADHHRHAMRPYQVLRHVDESPKMPAGYPAMMLASLIPPLWRAVMHPLLPPAPSTDRGLPPP